MRFIFSFISEVVVSCIIFPFLVINFYLESYELYYV